jgi:glycosyltransferase, family 8
MKKKDKSKCNEHIELIKQIWNERDIVIVEGCKTRSGIGYDLYDNANSIQRVLGPALSGFDRYDDIYDFIINNINKNKLILLSFGITATVLAYELAKLGYQAIDLGHLDIEYEWFRMGAKDRVPIKGKFTNESKAGHNPEACKDPKYQKQIIADFSK